MNMFDSIIWAGSSQFENGNWETKEGADFVGHKVSS